MFRDYIRSNDRESRQTGFKMVWERGIGNWSNPLAKDALNDDDGRGTSDGSGTRAFSEARSQFLMAGDLVVVSATWL